MMLDQFRRAQKRMSSTYVYLSVMFHSCLDIQFLRLLRCWIKSPFVQQQTAVGLSGLLDHISDALPNERVQSIEERKLRLIADSRIGPVWVGTDSQAIC